MGEVEPVRDFDQSTKDKPVQARDKLSQEPVWQVAVMDGDPKCKPSQKTVTVKIASTDQPVAPALTAEMPIVPVTFEHMWVTPYVDQRTGRLAYSFRASGMKPSGRRAGNTATGAAGGTA
ncbi:plasmid replication, integration and excision activator [Nonomuraea sp. NPDC048892]|uniref:plasmid replication, integration and excision activator n=1 Tax=Nonomuraea sp. NPDC048892 TaxID=3154624 RepID=UPI003409FF15